MKSRQVNKQGNSGKVAGLQQILGSEWQKSSGFMVVCVGLGDVNSASVIIVNSCAGVQ